MRTGTVWRAAAAAAIAALAAACGSTSDTTSSTAAPAASSGGGAAATTGTSGPFKVAFILVGPRNDGGWSQAHYAGAQQVAKELGDKVQVIVKESVPEGPQSQQVIEDLVKNQGVKMVFATSFGYGDALAALAPKYPDVKFEHATGAKTGPNLAVYYGAGEDGIFLSGMAAGAATQNGKVGYVVPFPIPEVIRHANAFALGVQKTHPGATVKLIWTKSWFDPTKETNAAESLVSWGADVVGQNVDSPAAGKVAEARKVKWIGYDSDASAAAPSAYLTAAVYDWGPYYLQRVKAAIDGSWATGSYYGNLGDGFVQLAPFGKGVSDATKTAINAELEKLKSTPQAEFAGPIKDQAGTEKIPAGSTATLDQLLAIDWLVQGVQGNPKG